MSKAESKKTVASVSEESITAWRQVKGADGIQSCRSTDGKFLYVRVDTTANYGNSTKGISHAIGTTRGFNREFDGDVMADLKFYVRNEKPEVKKSTKTLDNMSKAELQTLLKSLMDK